MMNTFYAENRDEWRNWLLQNYKDTREIWLIYYKVHMDVPCITYGESVEEAICFGWVDGLIHGIDDEKYKRRFTPRKNGSIWSKINKERAQKMISLGKMTPAGLETIEIAKQNGQWDKAYRMKEKIELPDDLKEALTKNPVAWKNFQKYSNSNRFIIITRIEKANTIEKRKAKISRAVELAEKNMKPYDKNLKPLI